MAQIIQNTENLLIQSGPSQVYCRICLSTSLSNDYKKISMLYDSFQTIAEIIEGFANIKFEETNEFPKIICQNCFEKLIMAVKFKTLIQETHIKLLRCLIENNELLKASIAPKRCEPTNKEFGGRKVSRDQIEIYENEETSGRFNNNNMLTELSLDNDISLSNNCDTIISNEEAVEVDVEINKKLNKFKCSLKSPPTVDILNNGDLIFIAETNADQLIENTNQLSYTIQLPENDTRLSESCTEYSIVENQNKEFNLILRRQLFKRNSKVPSAKCPKCNQIIKGLQNIKAHCKIHDNFYRYRCSFCNQGYWYKYHCNLHEATIHNNISRHQCEKCGKVFRTRLYLNVHKHVHSDATFQCDECGKVFKWKNALQTHQLNHKDEFRYECKICNIKYKTRIQIANHNRHHHLPELKKICTICGKAVESLAYHIKTHTKPFKCNVCNASFGSATGLKKHQFGHSDERPFACKFCNKTFKYDSSLRGHARGHEVIKRFTCEFCSRQFSHRYAMHRHQKNVHKEHVKVTLS